MQDIVLANRDAVARRQAPLFGRFVSKLVIDVMPAALASLIGGFLYTQYQHAHAPAPQPVAEQSTPASAEMMRLVRDEHAAIIDYLKTQTSLERTRAAAEDADSTRAVVEAKTAATQRQHTAAALSAPSPKPILARSSAPSSAAVIEAPHVPIIVAQAAPSDIPAPVAAAPRQSDGLLAKTIAVKDNVVHAALHTVSVIGGIPNWIADRFGGADPEAEPAPRQFSAS